METAKVAIQSCEKSCRKRDLHVKNNSTNRNSYLSSRTYSQEFENTVWTHDQEEKEKKKKRKRKEKEKNKVGEVALLDTRKSSCKHQPQGHHYKFTAEYTWSIGDRLFSVSANVLSCPIFLLSYFHSRVPTLSCVELFQA